MLAPIWTDWGSSCLFVVICFSLFGFYYLFKVFADVHGGIYDGAAAVDHEYVLRLECAGERLGAFPLGVPEHQHGFIVVL